MASHDRASRQGPTDASTCPEPVFGHAVGITERERAVLELYLSGMAAKQVATRLGLKETTVKEYLRRVRARYATAGRPASTRMELYFHAVEDGILPRARTRA